MCLWLFSSTHHQWHHSEIDRRIFRDRIKKNHISCYSAPVIPARTPSGARRRQPVLLHFRLRIFCLGRIRIAAVTFSSAAVPLWCVKTVVFCCLVCKMHDCPWNRCGLEGRLCFLQISVYFFCIYAVFTEMLIIFARGADTITEPGFCTVFSPQRSEWYFSCSCSGHVEAVLILTKKIWSSDSSDCSSPLQWVGVDPSRPWAHRRWCGAWTRLIWSFICCTVSL